MNIEVIEKGLSSTIQDLGRYHHQIEGFPVSGAIDPYSFRLANLLVDNPITAAQIEFLILGPSLRFSGHTFIAITGGNSHPQLNGQPISINQTIEVNDGDCLSFSTIDNGRFGYISFAGGGIKTNEVMDSRSTTIKAQIGGMFGRALEIGDKIPADESFFMPGVNWRKAEITKDFPETIHFLTGPQWDIFNPKAIRSFVEQTFTSPLQGDRMGYRLQEQIEPAPKISILSQGTVFGNVQVTSNGQAIVLLADRQTTGGYPVIATIIAADIPYFVQMPAGRKFHFEKTNYHDAVLRIADTRQNLKKIVDQWRFKKYHFPIGPSRKSAPAIQKLIEISSRRKE